MALHQGIIPFHLDMQFISDEGEGLFHQLIKPK